MKTAISLPDDTFERVDRAAKQLGLSRSEFFARAAERWLAALEDDWTTAAIDSALAGRQHDTAFTDVAADAVARSSFVDRACGGPRTRPRRDPRHPPLHAPSVTTAPVLLDASAVGGGEPDPSGHLPPTVRVLDLHFDADFERLAAHTDLAVPVKALAPLGSLP